MKFLFDLKIYLKIKGNVKVMNMKKIISIVLIYIFMLGIIPFNIINSNAAPNYDYALTGNSRDDVITIAKAQKGKRASDFGFIGGWCDQFIKWTFTQAGISYGNNLSGPVCDMAMWFVKNQSTHHYFTNSCACVGNNKGTSFDLLAGDLIFFKWNGKNHVGHVGIIWKVDGNNIHFVDGNFGSADPQVHTHEGVNIGTIVEAVDKRV